MRKVGVSTVSGTLCMFDLCDVGGAGIRQAKCDDVGGGDLL